MRLACWLWFVGAGVRPLVDEQGYFRTADVWAEVLRGLAHLSLPSVSLLARAWQEPIWPPLHPFLLGVARALPGDDLAAARLVGVVAGAATTLLVAGLTARLAGPRAARAAAWLHALYPSFVFFSVALWSETLFVLLLIALLGLVVRRIDAGPEPASVPPLLLGVGAALLLLTRAAALPMVAGLLGWLALRPPRGRSLRAAGASALLALLLVLPWSAASSWFAGRPVFLASSDTLNLALGNNPWTPPALGSAWDVPELRKRVLEAAADERAGEIARREVLGHPLRTALRVVVRAGQLLGLDFFPLRHLATGSLPPLPAWTLPAGLLVQWLSLALLLFLAGAGACGPDPVRHRSLLLTLASAGAAGPLATIAMPRLALPLLALLLPAAGSGWARLGRAASRPGPATLALLALASLALPVATLRPVVEHHLSPSSHYAAALEPVARGLGAAPLYTDLLACRPVTQAEALPALAAPAPQGTRWLDAEALPALLRRPDEAIRHVAVAGSGLEGPMALLAADGARTPVTGKERWRRFLPVSGTGLECAWQGAVFPRLE